jgi:uncharacterized membrane protein YvbJ
MVYCTKCGTKNPDDARVCSQCGSSLYAVGDRDYYRRVEKECFGIPRGSTIVGLAFGAFIIFWGLVWILQQTNVISQEVSVWPFAIIILGVLIVVGALYGMRRRY